MHGEQRFTYTRPVVAGDVLTATLTVDSLRQIGGADIIGTRSEITDADGRPGVHRVRDPGAPRGGRMSTLTDRRHELPEQTYTVTRADLVRYAGASGDLNPIHWSDRVAALGRAARRHRARHVHPGAGRPRPGHLGRRPGRVRELGCKFTKPVVVPDDDTGVEVVVARHRQERPDEGVQIALEVTCGGEKVLGMPKAVLRG